MKAQKKKFGHEKRYQKTINQNFLKKEAELKLLVEW
jgi:hypothetical protein